MDDAKTKVRNKPSEVSRQQKLEKIQELEEMFKVEVDLSSATLGDVSRLASSESSFEVRLNTIQKLLSKGKAEDIPLLKLEEFMDLITLKLEVQSNPTSGASTNGK